MLLGQQPGWYRLAYQHGSESSCTNSLHYAVDQALTAIAADAPPIGKYIMTGLMGYYMVGFGPIVTKSVKFFLSALFHS